MAHFPVWSVVISILGQNDNKAVWGGVASICGSTLPAIAFLRASSHFRKLSVLAEIVGSGESFSFGTVCSSSTSIPVCIAAVAHIAISLTLYTELLVVFILSKLLSYMYGYRGYGKLCLASGG